MLEKFPIHSEGFSPFRELVGVTFVKVDEGYSQCVLEVHEKLLNPFGTLHGGVAFTMADSGMGVALFSIMGENDICSTIETNIIYFKTVKSGTVICDTQIIHRNRRLVTLESEIKQSGQLIAKAIGTWTIRRERELA